jgi:hypothetical protein
MPGNGDGTFEGILGYAGPTADIRLGLAVGDFNGDGKPDIVVANYDINGVTVLLNETVPYGAQSHTKRKSNVTSRKCLATAAAQCGGAVQPDRY